MMIMSQSTTMASTTDSLTGLNFTPMSTVEQRTLESLSRGLSKKSISSVLGVSKEDVKKTIDSLKNKFDASSSKQLIAQVLESGIVNSPSSWARGATLPPHNPFMGPPGTSSMHANAASSDATLNPGPGTGGKYRFTINNDTAATDISKTFPYALPTVMMPENGSLLGVGVGNTLANKEIPTVLLISPFTLDILDSYELEAPESGNLAGGVYSYIDNDNNLVLVDGDGNLRWFNSTYDMATDTGALIEAKPSAPINQPMVVGLVPDYKGNIWYATQGSTDSSSDEIAVVGLYGPKGDQMTFQLPAGEMVANSISSSPAGVAVATTKALYLFNYNKNDQDIEEVWRYEYENSGYRKPGQLSPGTGATPVFFGPKTGFEYIAITDNMATNNGNTPAENFNIYKTRKVADNKSQLVGSLPFLSTTNSGTENAPIAVGKSVFSPSTYGYWYPPTSQTDESTPSGAAFVGGAQRVDFTGKQKTGKSLVSKWQSEVVSTALPRLSIADEQIYTVLGKYDSTLFGNQVEYSFGSIDAKTGEYSVLSNLGLTNSWAGDYPQTWVPSSYNYNTLQMTGVISPEGVFYQGMAAGIFSIEGPRARFGTGITSNNYSFTNSVSYDGNGYTYSADAISSADTSQWQGPTFDIQGEGVNGMNFSWANGQSIMVDGAGSNVITLFGSSVNGKLEGVNITVNYTDGSSSTWVQSFSDWCDPNFYSGEAIYSSQPYRNISNGSINSTTNNIYAYQYALEAGKQIESITLPYEYNLRILDVDVAFMQQVDINGNTFGITTPPWQVGNNQGFDGRGNYYSSFTIAGDSSGSSAQQNDNIRSYMPLSWNGVTFNIGQLPTSNSQVGGSRGPSNVLKTNGTLIDVMDGSFDKLYIAGAGSNGNQSGDFILNWSDGSPSTTWNQTFSDWRNGGNSNAPTGVEGQDVIVQGQVVNQLGNVTNDNNWIYGYSFDLNGRTLDSITLPNNGNIGILGITLM